MVTLVLDKYGPIERYLIDELRQRGLAVNHINARNGRMGYSDDIGVLLIEDVVKAYILSPLFKLTINSGEAYHAATNRLHLYRLLMSKGLPVPRVYVTQSPDEVGNLIKELGPALLATPSRSLSIDGKVSSWEGGKSVAEHRLYMDNPLASINLVIPSPREIRECLVIGDESSCDDELTVKVAKELGCTYCLITLGLYEEAVALDVDPRIRLEDPSSRERFIIKLMELVRR